MLKYNRHKNRMDRKRKYCYGNKRGIKLLKTDAPKCRRYKRNQRHEPCL